MAFKFYDYDNNGNIGSVDILNLLKHFNTDRVDQIASNQERIYQLKQQKKALAQGEKPTDLSQQLTDKEMDKLITKLQKLKPENYMEDQEES